MSGWGLGGTFRALSTRLFGDDLADELDPSMAYASSSPQVHPSSSLPPPNGHLVHVRSRREHQPRPRPADLSAEQLQESMKELMRHPKLWTMYKEELSMDEQPTHPETVRRVLIHFLESHGHEMASKPTTTFATTTNPRGARSQSIFQGWNVGLEEESTHVPRNRPTPAFPKNKSGSKGQSKGDDLQSRMKRVMRHPELWSKYKALLSQEDSPEDPGTIRRLFIEFWTEHEPQILRLEKNLHFHHPTNETKLGGDHPAPPSIFQAFNTDLISESQHIQSLPSQNSQAANLRRSIGSQRQSQVDTHRQLRLLRSSPGLYAKYQERLLMDESEEDTPAADLLSKFLLEHKDELAALDLAAKLKEEEEASLLDLETATMEEEKTEPSIKVTRDKREKKLQPDRRQKFMAYRDTISSQSIRGIQEAMEALAGEATSGPSPDTKQRISPISETNLKKVNPSVMSQSEHPQPSRDRRQKFMVYKETISSRSLRGIQEAMDSLSGEATTMTPAEQKVDLSIISNAVNTEGQTPRTSLRDSISEEGDLNASISSLMAWGQAFSLSNVTKFVTHEMETLTSELDDCEPLMKQDLELMPTKGTYASRGDNNDSKENEDDDDDDDGDLMLQQAAEIAVRHRRFHASNEGILESIPDENDEDGIDSKYVSADSSVPSNSPKSMTAPADPEPSSVKLTVEPNESPQETVSSLEKNGDSSHDDIADDDSLI